MSSYRTTDLELSYLELASDQREIKKKSRYLSYFSEVHGLRISFVPVSSTRMNYKLNV